MILKFTKQADEDLEYFRKTGNNQVVKKTKELLHSILANPYSGIGQPEPLKHNLSGTWSRRINREHRLIYKIDAEIVYVISLRGHYS